MRLGPSYGETRMEDLISIIVPVYKVEKYLHRCVDSLVNQSYENLEIVLVDDGSPDSCGKICDDYGQTDARVNVVHKKNGGLSDARNIGIEVSTGKYITFLDSDDWVKSNYIETLYELLKENNADVSICSFNKTSSIIVQDEKPLKAIKSYLYTNKEALKEMYGEYYIQMIVAWGKLFRRELFNNIRFPVGKVHEDEFVIYKIFYKAQKIIYTDQQLLFYWQRPDSIMGAGFNLQHELDNLQAHLERDEFFLSINEKDLYEKNCLRLFKIYRHILQKVRPADAQILDSKNFIDGYRQLKRRIRKINQPLKKKIKCEIFFTSPKIYGFLYKLRHGLFFSDITVE